MRSEQKLLFCGGLLAEKSRRLPSPPLVPRAEGDFRSRGFPAPTFPGSSSHQAGSHRARPPGRRQAVHLRAVLPDRPGDFGPDAAAEGATGKDPAGSPTPAGGISGCGRPVQAHLAGRAGQAGPRTAAAGRGRRTAHPAAGPFRRAAGREVSARTDGSGSSTAHAAATAGRAQRPWVPPGKPAPVKQGVGLQPLGPTAGPTAPTAPTAPSPRPRPEGRRGPSGYCPFFWGPWPLVLGIVLLPPGRGAAKFQSTGCRSCCVFLWVQ